jgi:restriction system protein
MIERAPPTDWRNLQDNTAKILSECGFESHTDVEIRRARGRVSVDVLANDPSATPPATYICECKHWQRVVSKDVIHDFRTVVVDADAHRGFVISSAGFQDGAQEAAKHSRVALVSWEEFQQCFVERWFRTFMAPTLRKEGEALHDYTEPFNSRIARKASALPPDRREQFRMLQERYTVPSFVLLMLSYDPLARKPKVPVLPLRSSLGPLAPVELPTNILNAPALRPLMGAITQFYRHTTAEFDAVFGERA